MVETTSKHDMNVMLMRMRMATSWPASSWGLLPARHACRLYRRPGPRPHLACAAQVLVDGRRCGLHRLACLYRQPDPRPHLACAAQVLVDGRRCGLYRLARIYRHTDPRPHLARAPQVLVDRRGCADDRQMAELGPGALLQVSGVVGRG